MVITNATMRRERIQLLLALLQLNCSTLSMQLNTRYQSHGHWRRSRQCGAEHGHNTTLGSLALTWVTLLRALVCLPHEHPTQFTHFAHGIFCYCFCFFILNIFAMRCVPWRRLQIWNAITVAAGYGVTRRRCCGGCCCFGFLAGIKWQRTRI